MINFLWYWPFWAVVAAVLLGVPLLLRLLSRILHDRRLAPRRRGDPRDVRVVGMDLADRSMHALVIDRSQSGLSLLIDVAVPPATPLQVRVETATEEAPWVPVTVRHCRPAGPNWLIGCEFVEPPAWAVLQLFG